MEILDLSVLHLFVMQPIKKNCGKLCWYFLFRDALIFHSFLYTVNLFYLVYIYFQDGHIDMLSSDHSPTVPELKLLDDGNFLKAWGGISSLQVGVFMFRINDNSLYSLVSSTMELDRKTLIVAIIYIEHS